MIDLKERLMEPLNEYSKERGTKANNYLKTKLQLAVDKLFEIGSWGKLQEVTKEFSRFVHDESFKGNSPNLYKAYKKVLQYLRSCMQWYSTDFEEIQQKLSLMEEEKFSYMHNENPE